MVQFNQALEVTLMGMAGIFIFMFIFYVSIRVIDRVFPEEVKRS
ncbi:MAG TPA: OadG-related small transporter subunit [Chitinophagaceae bacterium]